MNNISIKLLLLKTKQNKKQQSGTFPSGPVATTVLFDAGGPGSIPAGELRLSCSQINIWNTNIKEQQEKVKQKEFLQANIPHRTDSDMSPA